MIYEQRIERMLAHLMRNERVSPEAIERAVTSAVDMRAGEFVSLTGDPLASLRRAFVQEQHKRLEKR